RDRIPGRRCAGAAARGGAAGRIAGAVSVSGPIDRMGRRPGARWAADLVAAADALHKRL
ncbi:IclR family transcriptional regulator, partial [Nocardia sp. NPDC004582]